MLSVQITCSTKPISKGTESQNEHIEQTDMAIRRQAECPRSHHWSVCSFGVQDVLRWTPQSHGHSGIWGHRFSWPLHWSHRWWLFSLSCLINILHLIFIIKCPKTHLQTRLFRQGSRMDNVPVASVSLTASGKDACQCATRGRGGCSPTTWSKQIS